MTGNSLEPLDPHAEVEHGHDDGGGVALRYNPDAPSEEWGWHGHWRDFSPVGRFGLLGLGVVGLLLMLLGNHQSHVEDWILVVTAALLVAWMVRSEIAHRRRRRIRP